jgi:serine/threonine-protein kinase
MAKTSKTISLYKGKLIGNWNLMSKLGSGGNGDVWKCRAKDGNSIAAIKFLKTTRGYQRFKDEVFIQEKTANNLNIMPIMDKSLPKIGKDFDIHKTPIYYVMPLCKPLSKELKTLSFEQRIAIIEGLLITVASLHAIDIAHRDIKIDNILKLDNRYVLSDFGLTFYKGKRKITKSTEKVGAKTSIAPEMERPGADKADAYKADVYSIAKVIWIVLTNEITSFEGQYFKGSAISFSNYKSLSEQNIYWSPLESLLRNCTDHNPSLRPTAEEMLQQFLDWKDINKDNKFSNRCIAEWDEVTYDLFPYSKPSRADWTDASSAVRVLNVISKYSNLNHLFFPSGGLDLVSAKVYDESNWIELVVGGFPLILKLMKLTFYSFNNDNNWNYFRIEVDPVEALFNNTENYQQQLIEISPMKFVPLELADRREDYAKNNITATSIFITRHLNGDLVIFNKVSPYNTDNAQNTYDGRHATLTSDQFRQYIEECAKQGKLLGNWMNFRDK